MRAQTDKGANLQTLDEYMEQAASSGVHLLVFPEMALQQNPCWGIPSYQPTDEELTYLQGAAETVPGESTEWLVQRAQQHRIFIVLGMAELGSDEAIYSTMVFLGPEGILAAHRKYQLFDDTAAGNEHRYLSAGVAQGTLVDSPLGQVGLMFGAEMYLGLDGYYGYHMPWEDTGADLVVVSTTWTDHLDSAQLYENSTVGSAKKFSAWHVVANQVGPVAHLNGEVYGHSRVLAPDGTIAADTGFEEGMAIATTDILIDHPLFSPAATAVQGTSWGVLKAH